jgi:hypothetical protein
MDSATFAFVTTRAARSCAPVCNVSFAASRLSLSTTATRATSGRPRPVCAVISAGERPAFAKPLTIS